MTPSRLVLLCLGTGIAAAIVVPGCTTRLPELHELPERVGGGAPRTTIEAANAVGEAELRSVDVVSRPMPLLDAGLTIGDRPPDGWSHLVLHAVPRVAEGDVDKVSTLVARLAGLFHLVVLANVERSDDLSRRQYVLENVAIGLAMAIEGHEITVSSNGPATSDAQLDFMERTALSQNEASLKTARQVARTATMVVFDAETILWRDGDHLHTIQRHAVLASPANGRLATLVWPLETLSRDRYRACDGSLQWLPDGLHEDRTLHVDAAKFALGIPTQEAFALVRLPQGRPVPLTPALQDVVESNFAKPEQAVLIEQALRSAIGWDRDDEPASDGLER